MDDIKAPASPPESPDSELKQLEKSVVSVVANLYKISFVVRSNPAPQDRLLKSAKIDVSFYEPFDIQHTRNKFPLAADLLLERLGKAISRRRQYLLYCERHQQKLSAIPRESSLEPTQIDNTPTVPESDHDIFISQQQLPSKEFEPSVKQSVHSALSKTTASTFIAPKDNVPIDLDTVDMLSDGATQTSYAASSLTGDKMYLPPPPKFSREFECPYCYKICKLHNTETWQRNRDWRRHYSGTWLRICVPSQTATSQIQCSKKEENGCRMSFKYIGENGFVMSLVI